jgi:hypothetical protein
MKISRETLNLILIGCEAKGTHWARRQKTEASRQGRSKSGTRISAFPLVPESQFSRPRRPHSFDPTVRYLAEKFLVVTCRDTDM